MSKEIVIHELDISRMIGPFSESDFTNPMVLLCLGKRGSGKSVLVKDLIYRKRHIIPTIQVYSGSEAANGFYKEFIPDIFIFDELSKNNMQYVDNFIKRQKLAKQYFVPAGVNPFALMVIDDSGADLKWTKHPSVHTLVRNGRHIAMNLIIALQYAMDLPPEIRSNLDGVFVFKDNILANRKRLYEQYVGNIDGLTFNDFCTIMDRITEDYTALYINTKPTKNNSIQDVLFYYKANPQASKGFRFGCEELKKFHDARRSAQEFGV
jgi:hypothetical protein